MDFVTILISRGGLYKPPSYGGRFVTPTIFMSHLVNNEYLLMSLNWVACSEECKSSWDNCIILQ